MNSFLAYVPIELSFQIKRVSSNSLRYGLLALWLLFFPNIPYLATDMVHGNLVNIYHNATKLSVETVKGWGYILLLFLMAFAYINWGFMEGLSLARYFQVQHKWKKRTGIFLGTVVCFLSSMGMYAGRFAPRLHSVYLFTDPLKVIHIIFFNWSVKKLELVALFFLLHAAILLVFYVMYTQARLVSAKKDG